MSTTTDKALNDLVEAKVREILDKRLDTLVEEKFQKALKAKPKRMAIAVVSKGTIEAAYSALILATAAAAMEIETGLYFSFFGLNILKKKNQGSLKVVPLGNPAMPVTMPNIISVLPGMTAFATMMMKATIKRKKIATVSELMEIAVESGVKLWPCQMAMDMFDIKKEDLIDGLPDPVGAATFLEFSSEADITLFI
ncbi:MAG TPA: DsrE/DsrF/DrsH-like family protein [Nitrospiria bacterium]